ncbi:unnamed protein product [Candidula unifasciata]|uniref:Uncharacterized protein n=1 Tax=Candidula unifasciata TaxID=100452 RepID=A0A8S3ZRH3_9EUPU|nr:unnamed protein product [Candidula unifasciata]
MSSENQPLHTAEERQYYNFFLANIKLIARTMGLITVAVMWVSTVIIINDYSKSYLGYYLIAASSVVTFFEVTWILDKMACCVREGCCCRMWAAIMWVDNWKKFILYVLLAVPLFLENMRLVLGIVSGLLLILLSTLYLIKTFRTYNAVYYETTEQRRQVIISKTPSIQHRLYTATDVSEDGGATGPSPS